MPEPHDRTFTIETLSEPARPGDRDTIGGWPLLPEGESWPECYCGKRMAFFFQVEIPAELAPFGGDQLQAFQCPEHDESAEGPAQLPPRYWDEVFDPYEGPYWRIFLRGASTPAAEADPHFEPRGLALHPAAEEIDPHGRGLQGFKVGGVPSWAQDPQWHRCACGTEMVFLAQVPENFGFDMWPARAGAEDAMLFLGNEIYILACPARCHPEAAWPVPQN